MSQEEGNIPIGEGSIQGDNPPKDENVPSSPQIASRKTHLYLELGDIIEIAAGNTSIHEQAFYVLYIDAEVMRLFNVSTREIVSVEIDAEGNLSDESITGISLLSRSEVRGFARQNGLLPKVWVDIHFGGEIPSIFTAEIVNLEEDMIELITFPEMKTIYLDFGYKGLPKDIPIEKIVVRDRPHSLASGEDLESLANAADESRELTEQASIEYTDSGESIISIPEGTKPDENVREILHKMYVRASDIVFEDLGEFTQMVEVPEWQKKYSIETQVSDLTEQLISHVPDNKRTTRVLNHIHHLTTRFTQLRNEFSVFDESGGVKTHKWVGKLAKPVVDRIMEFDRNLRWLMPVVVNKRKLFNYKNAAVPLDAEKVELDEELGEQEKIMKNYDTRDATGDESKYIMMAKNIDALQTPFLPPNERIYPNALLSTHKRVKAALEGIVNNLGAFHSSVVHQDKISKRRFIIQKFSLGESRLATTTMRSGRKIAVRQPINADDEIFVQSVLMFPRAVVEYSKAFLPSTTMAKRVQLSQMHFSPTFAIRSGRRIETHVIEDLDNEIDYEGDEEKANDFLKGMKHYVLDDGITIEEGTTFEKFLKVIFPKTNMFIRMMRKYVKNEFTMAAVAREMEPLGISTNELTFSHYMEIRYYIKEQIKEQKKIIVTKSKEFLAYLTSDFGVLPPLNRIGDIFKEKTEMLEWMKDAYKYNSVLNGNGEGEGDGEGVGEGDGAAKPRDLMAKKTSSEVLRDLYEADEAQLYSKMVSYLMLSLITPDKLLDNLAAPKVDDATDVEKVKAGDCVSRVIAKKYESVAQLQKDNNTEDVFFDKVFDDTPYNILSKYKSERKSKTPDHFLEYFTEVLVSKHDCPEALARPLAETIIAGKKRVEEGHYAMLVLRPRPPLDMDLDKLSAKEREDVDREAELRTKTQYYKRMGENWIHDDTVNEETFIDGNTIFCNLDAKCHYNTEALGDKCLPTSVSALKMKHASQQRLIHELDKRFTLSVEQIEQQLTETIVHLRKKLKNSLILRGVHQQKQNDICVSIGKQLLVSGDDAPKSPYLRLRDLIMSQTDFVKKQEDIVRFVVSFTREHMKELNEHAEWHYCVKTNTPLFPNSVFELAQCFVNTPENYSNKLDEVTRRYGKKVDNMIVDKHSGWALKYLDLEVEEQYDESGHRIKTHDVIEKDLGTLILEAIANKDKVFDNPDAQKVFNIFSALSTNIGLKKDAIDGGIEEFVLRVSLELINNKSSVVIPSEQAYKKRLEKEKEKQKKTALPPYEVYRDELIVVIVSATLFVAVQCMIPSFKTSITFPTCVQSFGGYPIETGMENTSGIKYLACVLEKMKGSHSKIWKAVATIKADGFEKRITKIIQDYLLIRQDINNLYILKREYLSLHPEENIPPEASVAKKWLQFLPPLVETKMAVALQGITADYESELFNAMRNGSRGQHAMLSVLKTKLLKHAYGIVETVNHVVKTKNSLFMTASKNPYLQNACCNEDPKKIVPLMYFIEENANIDTYIRKSVKMAALLRQANAITRGDLLYHEPSTAIAYPVLPNGLELKSVYEAFIHYCKFDSDVPIPPALIPVCNEKPKDYNRHWSLEEKIEFLRGSGYNYGVEHLHRLMQVVNRRNLLPEVYSREVSQLNAFKDVLEHLELKGSIVVEAAIREKLWEVLKHVNLRTMVSKEVENELNEALRQLNRALAGSSAKMLNEILDFVGKYSQISNSEYAKLEKFLGEIDVWKIEEAGGATTTREHVLYNIHRYALNMAAFMTKDAPSIILNGGNYSAIPTHWKLSAQHKMDVYAFVNSHNEKLNAFKGVADIANLLRHVSPNLEDVVGFLRNIPMFAPIKKGDVVFYSAFSEESEKALLKYSLYSILYEYIVVAKNADLLTTKRRKPTTSARDRLNQNDLLAIDEIFGETPILGISPEVQEIDIIAGDKTELFRRVAKLLVCYLGIAQTNKKLIDIPYSQLDLGVGVTQMKEKKKITDFFENMEQDERRVQYQLKTLKLGEIWSEGLKKSIFQYNAETYDKSREETNQFFVSDLDTFGIDLGNAQYVASQLGTQEAMTTDELAALEETEQAEIYDAEGADISHLRSGFMDGRVYVEDEDEDESWGEE